MSLWSAPFPLPKFSADKAAIISLSVGGFIAFFLIAFQPFGTDDVDFPGKTWFLAGYGVITSAFVFFVTFLNQWIYPRVFSEDKWTVGKQIVAVALSVSGGIVASYVYLIQGLGGSFDWRNFSLFFRNAMLIAIFPIIGITLFDYIRHLRYNVKEAKAYSATLRAGSSSATRSPTKKSLTITDDQGRVQVAVDAEELWAVRSDGNYAEVFFRVDHNVQREIVRNTLTAIAKALPEYFVVTHRSWLVNLQLVDRVSGNAQGYQLHSEEFPEINVSLSRHRAKGILPRVRG